MFVPKKLKYKKQQKGKFFNKIYGNINSSQLFFGSVGLKAISFSRISSKQLEAFRKSLRKLVKKTSRIIINIIPNISISKKPIEVRMGKGKGKVNKIVFKVKPGFVLCEIITDKIAVAVKSLNLIKKKLNIKTKIIFS